MTDDLPPFSVSVMETPEGPVVMPHGELDMATADEAEQVALALVTSEQPSLTIDLSDVTFCDSAGVNALVRLRKVCHEAGGKLTVSNPRPNVRQVLDLSGLTEFLSVTPR